MADDLDALLAGVDKALDDVLTQAMPATDEFLRDFAQADGKTIHGEATRRSHLRMGRLLRRAGDQYFLSRGRKPPHAA